MKKFIPKHIPLKSGNRRQRKKSWKQRSKRTLKLRTGFQTETKEISMQWNGIFKEMTGNNRPNRIIQQVKISFKNKDDIKILPLKQKLKKLFPAYPHLKRNIKRKFLGQKCYQLQLETNKCMKE